MPATAVGDGDGLGRMGGACVATGLAVVDDDDVGDGGCADAAVVPVGGALWATVADGRAEVEAGLALA